MPVLKTNYSAPFFDNSNLTKKAATNARTYGSTVLEGETAAAAKAGARAAAYDAWKNTQGGLGDIASRIPTSELASQIERRGAGRAGAGLSDAAYEAMRDAGSGSRMAERNIMKETGQEGRLFSDYLNKTRLANTEYLQGLKAQPQSWGTRIGQGIDSGLGYLGESGIGRLASKVADFPGVRLAGRAMGGLLEATARPALYAQGAYDLGKIGYEGYKALAAQRDAGIESSESEEHYGTPERATATRYSNQGILNDWSTPDNYVDLRPNISPTSSRNYVELNPNNQTFSW